jgi:hypothetical protein
MYASIPDTIVVTAEHRRLSIVAAGSRVFTPTPDTKPSREISREVNTAAVAVVLMSAEDPTDDVEL